MIFGVDHIAGLVCVSLGSGVLMGAGLIHLSLRYEPLERWHD